MRQLIEKYSCLENGYKPCLITENWQVALLNYAEEQGFEHMTLYRLVFYCSKKLVSFQKNHIGIQKNITK
jgi:hypothetical protein